MSPHSFRLIGPLALGLFVAGSALAAAPATPAAKAAATPRNALVKKVKPTPPPPPVEEDLPLSEAQLAVAPQVSHGDVHCEFNQKVQITPDADKPGRFKLQFGKQVFHMAPEPTTTGAVRLEDKKAGVVWLQIPSKSMLMNTKVGQRMVDSCMHEDQKAFQAANAAPPAGEGLGITSLQQPAQQKQ
ncbi:hypothetical protein LZ017_21205 [Pelomonas sp. CA6]|uniref:hypothetical protein n=1 Tax=Pelomonas sp. CA6 TaxID=2907999 RepID=UPI001F4C2DDF|nr:hypothetical protein [Pelomonas sp. CA6]MCH7345895.1 hypothetical protein [Pelomonas sp. CA6]